jgi:hypothetical protein
MNSPLGCEQQFSIGTSTYPYEIAGGALYEEVISVDLVVTIRAQSEQVPAFVNTLLTPENNMMDVQPFSESATSAFPPITF